MKQKKLNNPKVIHKRKIKTCKLTLISQQYYKFRVIKQNADKI